MAIPPEECGDFPADYCPIPVQLYGWRRTGSGCVLERGWLHPDACLLPPPWRVLLPLLGRWERQSQRLAVGGEAQQAFQEFLPYFEEQQGQLGDPTLQQEADLLKKLASL